MSCILGGLYSVKRKFSHLVTAKKKLHWKETESKVANGGVPCHTDSRLIVDETNNSTTNMTKQMITEDNNTHSKESSISRSGSSSSTIPAGGSRPCSAQPDNSFRPKTPSNNQKVLFAQFNDNIPPRYTTKYTMFKQILHLDFTGND